MTRKKKTAAKGLQISIFIAREKRNGGEKGGTFRKEGRKFLLVKEIEYLYERGEIGCLTKTYPEFYLKECGAREERRSEPTPISKREGGKPVKYSLEKPNSTRDLPQDCLSLKKRMNGREKNLQMQVWLRLGPSLA